MLILDTSILIEIERENKKVKDVLYTYSRTHSGIPYITSLTYAEFLYGFLKIHKKQKALEILDLYELLAPTKKSAGLIAELKYTLEKKGITIQLADIFIAAIVLEHDAVLATMDTDFKKIENLRLLFVNP